MREQTHYQILGIPRDASHRTIRIAYRKALLNYHPDANAGDRSGEEMLRRVITAGRVLGNSRQRERYDRSLGVVPRAPQAQPATPSRAGLKIHFIPRLLKKGRHIIGRFFTRERAVATESRARHYRAKPKQFRFYLFVALSNNRPSSYQRGADGIYRKREKRGTGSGREWLRRTTVFLLGGVFWGGIRKD